MVILQFKAVHRDHTNFWDFASSVADTESIDSIGYMNLRTFEFHDLSEFVINVFNYNSRDLKINFQKNVDLSTIYFVYKFR